MRSSAWLVNGLRSNHVAYPVLQDAAYDVKPLTPKQWTHLGNCRQCTLEFEHLTRINAALKEISGTDSRTGR
jgi:hypothetical protein